MSDPTTIDDPMGDPIIVKNMLRLAKANTTWELELESKYKFTEDELVACLNLYGKYSGCSEFPVVDDDDIVSYQAKRGWETLRALRAS